MLTLRADGVTVRGLTVRNVGVSFTEDRAGIRIDAPRCVVADNHLVDTLFGIYACARLGLPDRGQSDRGTWPPAERHGNAIHLFNSAGFTVRRNLIRGHRDGIYLEFSRRAPSSTTGAPATCGTGCTSCFPTLRLQQQPVRTQRRRGCSHVQRTVTMAETASSTTGGRPRTVCCSRSCEDSRIEGNLFTGIPWDLGPKAPTGSVSRNRFVGMAGPFAFWGTRSDNRFRGNHSGNTFDVGTAPGRHPSTFFEELLGPLRGLRSRSRRLRGRTLPAGPAVFPDGGAT